MSKNKIVFLVIFLGIFISAAIIFQPRGKKPLENSAPAQIDSAGSNEKKLPGKDTNSTSESATSKKNQLFQPPLDRAGGRVTKKPFSVFITPQNSPVQPEHFSGYHAGTDFEIFPEELDADVPVKAICDGKILEKRTASGYGGILVQNCELDGQPITIIYGHLKLASITKKAGDSLSQGEEIGILGKAYSAETNGERKHLHLGIHQGSGIDIRGYVSSKAELSAWLDPCGYNLCV